MNNVCPCGSEKSFTECCQRYLTQNTIPSHPEALMRSRYSAYVEQNYDYVLSTYAPEKQAQITLAEIKDASTSTQWLKLDVLSSYAELEYGEVEFIAYYKIDKNFYSMHELSRFIKKDDHWYYLDGKMLNKSGKMKPARNTSCPCGSGKKFKRCCGQ